MLYGNFYVAHITVKVNINITFEHFFYLYAYPTGIT